MLASGQHRRYLDRLRPRLAAARALAIRLLAELGFEIADAADAGPFVWAGLPDAGVTERLAVEAWQSGILLARGNQFHPDRRASRYLRFNVGRSTDPRLFAELRRLLGKARSAD
jgi:DNA-binding transcriptional MocR family regulator